MDERNRIVRNTLMLYIRMFFNILIALITSRLILDVLGIVDYGIYNVVGGVVVLFTFLNSAMASSTQRFLTFEIGKGNQQRLRNIFSTSIFIHILISCLVLILAETIGLWLFYNKLIIPNDRLYAAMWVYQLSVCSCLVSIMSVPYNAAII
ncbi:MAG: lipopolysaccharide biosynthesis protein, partial [Parabacteroides sp.]|nr:lipopolysaccharide biosynthesis protein [Parabacteroides sp.]